MPCYLLSYTIYGTNARGLYSSDTSIIIPLLLLSLRANSVYYIVLNASCIIFNTYATHVTQILIFIQTYKLLL